MKVIFSETNIYGQRTRTWVENICSIHELIERQEQERRKNEAITAWMNRHTDWNPYDALMGKYDDDPMEW